MVHRVTLEPQAQPDSLDRQDGPAPPDPLDQREVRVGRVHEAVMGSLDRRVRWEIPGSPVRLVSPVVQDLLVTLAGLEMLVSRVVPVNQACRDLLGSLGQLEPLVCQGPEVYKVTSVHLGQ